MPTLIADTNLWAEIDMNIEQYRKEHCTDFVSDKCEHQEHANKIINEIKKGSKVIYTNTNCGDGYFFVVGFVECLNELKLVGQDCGALDDALECRFIEDKLIEDNFDDFLCCKAIEIPKLSIKKTVVVAKNHALSPIAKAFLNYCSKLDKQWKIPRD